METARSEDTSSYKNGVIQLKVDERKELMSFPKVVGIPPSILKAPIFVLSDEVSRKFQQIIVKWEKGAFTFSRTGENAFPTATHAFYFLIILSKFACAWNRDGKVSFKFAEILRLAGKNPRSPADPILEMVWRYMNCHANWENSFGPKYIAWAGSLIRKCDLWDDHNNLVKKNPGRSKDEKNWHTLWLHEEIVNALKEGETRLYYSRIYTMGLNPSEIIIYNYFYSFGDKKEYWHSLYDEEQGLIKAFSWTSPKHKFYNWLKKYLISLASKNLIGPFTFNPTNTAVLLKPLGFGDADEKIQMVSEHDTPENLQSVNGEFSDSEFELGKAVAEELTKSGVKSRRKGATKKIPLRTLAKLDDQAIVEEYLTRKNLGLLDQDTESAVDALLSMKLTSAAVTIIKSALTGKTSKKSKTDAQH
ncbi:MAG: hypothetical protein EOP04_03705 [Proteobacteria bacterium]|nr:MAG: hypothetical protein EOP04_03705 [Pseudomonadota bacterium]